MTYYTVIFFCFILSIASVKNVRSEWVENNGLWYYISRDEQPMDYKGANTKCETMNARLAVITDRNQDDFLLAKINDTVDRWIGLSSKKTNHSSSCDEWSWVWNYDWYCENEYGKSYIEDYFQVPVGCKATSFKVGEWYDYGCFTKLGFICQWECKRLYMYLDSRHYYSGMYYMDHYSNENIAYTKDGSHGQVHIRKLTASNGYHRWVVFDNGDASARRIASYFTDSNVPYGSDVTWVYWADGLYEELRYVTLCVECDTFQLCLENENDYLDCYGEFNLNYVSSEIPKYVNVESTLQIQHTDNSNFCLCYTDRPNCDSRCGYIFPYPFKSTLITLDNKQKWIFTNMCWKTKYTTIQPTVSESEQTVYVSYMFTNTRRSISTDGGGTNTAVGATESAIFYKTTFSTSQIRGTLTSKTILISTLIPASVLIIIIVSVVIVIVIRRRRKHKENMVTEEINTNRVTEEGNLYIELDDKNPNAAAPTSTTKLGHETSPPSSYAAYDNLDLTVGKPALAGHTTQGDADIDTHNVYSNEQLIGSYLAQDYGVLMDYELKPKPRTKNEDGSKTMPVYTEVKNKSSGVNNETPNEEYKSNHRNKFEDRVHESDDDLQLHENELYESRIDDTGKDQAKNMNFNDTNKNIKDVLIKTSKHANEKDSDYYNLGEYRSSSYGNKDDEDLEIFENSVYDPTQ